MRRPVRSSMSAMRGRCGCSGNASITTPTAPLLTRTRDPGGVGVRPVWNAWITSCLLDSSGSLISEPSDSRKSIASRPRPELIRFSIRSATWTTSVTGPGRIRRLVAGKPVFSSRM